MLVGSIKQANNTSQKTDLTYLIKCLHTAALNQISSTWIQVIKEGYLQSRPYLTEDKLQKHLP